MYSNKLKILEQEGLLRDIKDRAAKMAPYISLNGKTFINFASNDYLGLSCSALLADAARNAISDYGFGSGASRLLAGGTQLHAALEKQVAAFKRTEGALVFGSGYTANISSLSSLTGDGDIIFSDELNHASLIDACRLSKARKAVYRHRDVAHLSELMQLTGGHRKIVVTDTVFSMDGDMAPLAEISKLCRENNALLYLDDAHGTGVLGNGRGALAHFGIKPDSWIIQMGTFSKALGSYGAFIAADKSIIQWLINTARGFIYSTALPACIAAASLKALELVESEPSLIKRLWQNRDRLFNGLQALSVDTLSSETPIIPVVAGDLEQTSDLSRLLLDQGIYCPAIRPPTVARPRLRITLTAAHNEEHIDTLLGALGEIL
jgi:8-amino-7-oxononanoate synthase